MRDVPRETQERLETYLSLLAQWNFRINLVAPGTRDEWWKRHFLDSLQLGDLLPPGHAPIADLGSGGGFPGMVLAFVQTRPVHLIESDQRKCAFLREVARVGGLTHVTVHPCRIDQVSLPPLACVTARALSPLSDLLEHASGLLAADGAALFPKGRNAEAELTEAVSRWHMAVERFPSTTDSQSTIFRIRDIRPA